VVEQKKIPARDGTLIRALLYTPHGTIENGSCLIFFHGGGFVYQAAPHHFILARRLALALKVKTLFVDYRLGPKHKFPTALDDAFDAYNWIITNANELQINTSRIALCGDSAGGTLTAVVCLMARERNVQIPCGQMLLYPFVDRHMDSESMKKFTDTPMCNSVAGAKFNALYMPLDNHENIEYFSPLEAASLAGLPPAYVETAEFDCLHDDGINYINALREAGIHTELHETKGTMHGYDIAVNSHLVQDLMSKRIGFLQNILSS
jgi:acetyl esterase/lipase